MTDKTSPNHHDANSQKIREKYIEATRLEDDYNSKILLLNLYTEYMRYGVYLMALFGGLYFCVSFFNPAVIPRLLPLLQIFSMVFLVLWVVYMYVETRISAVNEKYGMKNRDSLFLYTWRVITALESLEKTPDRLVARETALENMTKIIEGVNKWSYGNLDIVKAFVGLEVDLFKTNLSEKALGYIKESPNAYLLKESLSEFLLYLLSPSKKKFLKVNEPFSKIEPIPYVVISKKEKLATDISGFFIKRPNLVRLISGFLLAGVLYYYIIEYQGWELEGSLGAILGAFGLGFAISEPLLELEKRSEDREKTIKRHANYA